MQGRALGVAHYDAALEIEIDEWRVVFLCFLFFRDATSLGAKLSAKVLGALPRWEAGRWGQRARCNPWGK